MKKKELKLARAATAALLAIMLFQIWIPGLAGTSSTEYTYQDFKTGTKRDSNATATYTNITNKYTRTITESNGTPLAGAYVPEHVTDSSEESWEIPGTPINETVELYFTFWLDANLLDHGQLTVSPETIPLYFGNLKIVLWFVGYAFNSSLKDAAPYQSVQIELDTEQEVQNGKLQIVFLPATNTTAYIYSGTLRNLFGIADESFITACRLYAISTIVREPLLENYNINTMRDKIGDVYWEGKYKDYMERWYYVEYASPSRTTLNWGSEYTYEPTPTSKAEEKVYTWNDLFGNHVDERDFVYKSTFYYKLFQIYLPPGTQNITVNTSVKADEEQWYQNFYMITQEGELQPTEEDAFVKWERVGVSGNPHTAFYNYTRADLKPGWYYFVITTPLANLRINVKTAIDSVQPLEKLNSAQIVLDEASTDKLGKLWYSSVCFKNTTVTHNITNTSQTWTEWNNKTYTFLYYNNSAGTSNITYNGTDYINGTWTPGEPPATNTGWLEVNSNNPYGSNSTNWFLKYSYTIYNRTVIELNKTITTLSFKYTYPYECKFNYTEKFDMPEQFGIDMLEGKVAVGMDALYLCFHSELLMESYEYFDTYNKNQSTEFIQPELQKVVGQGTYIKNCWAALAPHPAAFGTYTWVTQEGTIKPYYYYEVIPPWSLYHSYSVVGGAGHSLTIITSPQPTLQYDTMNESYQYRFTNDQIVNFDVLNFTPQLHLTVTALIYQDGVLYDTETFAFYTNQTLQIHKLLKSRSKIYLKEDIWGEYKPYELPTFTYKLYTITPAEYGYNETGASEVQNFISPSYPFFGYILTCSSNMKQYMEEAMNISADIQNYTIDPALLADIENYTGTPISTMPNADVNMTEFMKTFDYLEDMYYYNVTFTIYTLDADRFFPAYKFYSYTIHVSPLAQIAAGEKMEVQIDEETTQLIEDAMQQGGNTANTTGNFTLTNLTDILPGDLGYELSIFAEASLFSANTTCNIIKVKCPQVENVTFVGYFDYFEVTDRTEITFRNKEDWSLYEIAQKLDTAEWLTYVKPMKANLEVSIDKEEPKKGEQVNCSIKLLIGESGAATIDNKLAAANQSVDITYPINEEGDMVTRTFYTNATGCIEFNFTAPDPNNRVEFKVAFDTARLELGSAEFTKVFYNPSLWGELNTILTILLLIGPILLIMVVTHDHWKKATSVKRRGR